MLTTLPVKFCALTEFHVRRWFGLMRVDNDLDFAEFDTLADPRDIAARDDAIALDRLAREVSQRRDAIVRRLRRSVALNPHAVISDVNILPVGKK